MITSLLGIFSGKWIKILIIVAVLTAVGGTVYSGYRYVTNLQNQILTLQSDNATLTANNATLEQAIADQRSTIDFLQQNFEEQKAIIAETTRNFQSARDQVTELENKLSKHDLGYLAKNKPGLVEGIINNAADNIGRCFEIASGSPLTTAEINATLPSEINTECPELANPSYRGTQ